MTRRILSWLCRIGPAAAAMLASVVFSAPLRAQGVQLIAPPSGYWLTKYDFAELNTWEFGGDRFLVSHNPHSAHIWRLLGSNIIFQGTVSAPGEGRFLRRSVSGERLMTVLGSELTIHELSSRKARTIDVGRTNGAVLHGDEVLVALESASPGSAQTVDVLDAATLQRRRSLRVPLASGQKFAQFSKSPDSATLMVSGGGEEMHVYERGALRKITRDAADALWTRAPVGESARTDCSLGASNGQRIAYSPGGRYAVNPFQASVTDLATCMKVLDSGKTARSAYRSTHAVASMESPALYFVGERNPGFVGTPVRSLYKIDRDAPWAPATRLLDLGDAGPSSLVVVGGVVYAAEAGFNKTVLVRWDRGQRTVIGDFPGSPLAVGVTPDRRVSHVVTQREIVEFRGTFEAVAGRLPYGGTTLNPAQSRWGIHYATADRRATLANYFGVIQFRYGAAAPELVAAIGPLDSGDGIVAFSASGDGGFLGADWKGRTFALDAQLKPATLANGLEAIAGVRWIHHDAGTSTLYVASENGVLYSKPAGRRKLEPAFESGGLPVMLQASTAFGPMFVTGDGRRRLLPGPGSVIDMIETDSGVVLAFDQAGYFATFGTGVSPMADLAYLIDGRQIPLQALYDHFFRPDLVLERIRTGKVAERLLNAREITRQAPPSVRLERVESAADLRRLETQAQVRIEFAARDEGSGVGEILVLHNGKLIRSDGFYRDAPGSTLVQINTTSATSAAATAAARLKLLGQGEATTSNTAGPAVADSLRRAPVKPLDAQGEFRDAVVVDVLPGEENEITVMARNAAGTFLGQGQTVRFRSTLPKAEPRVWVLAVGVGDFLDKRVPSLSSPRKDAIDFACLYAGRQAMSGHEAGCDKPGLAPRLFDNRNVHLAGLLTDRQATRTEVLAALDRIASQARPGDTFVWFVSSHGTMDAHSVYGIVPFDARCQDATCESVTGLVTSNDILDKSKAIKAMRQVLILDTCQAGGLDNKFSGLYDARMSGLAKSMGLHLYAAATATESALDGPDATRNSVFTATLLEGLAGGAPRGPDGSIGIVPLGRYVKERTPEASLRAFANVKPQTPVIQHFGLDAPIAIHR